MVICKNPWGLDLVKSSCLPFIHRLAFNIFYCSWQKPFQIKERLVLKKDKYKTKIPDFMPFIVKFKECLGATQKSKIPDYMLFRPFTIKFKV